MVLGNGAEVESVLAFVCSPPPPQRSRDKWTPRRARNAIMSNNSMPIRPPYVRISQDSCSKGMPNPSGGQQEPKSQPQTTGGGFKRRYRGKKDKAAVSKPSGSTEQASASAEQDQAAPAKKSRSRNSKKKAASSGHAGGSGAKANAREEDIRQKLKVVVRRLPPNLPEAIFWKSVEPWTGKQILPSPPTSDAQNSLRAKTARAASSTPVSATEDHAVRPASELKDIASATKSGGQSKEQAKGSEGPPRNGAVATDTPAVIRKSGPLVNLGCVAQEKLLWRRYISGKFKSHTVGIRGVTLNPHDPANPPTHSRAYLRFRNMADLLNFHRDFDGHVFRDSKGNESVALVEWAPYQKVPPNATRPPSKRRDKRQSTIEQDPDYLEFFEQLQKIERGDNKGAKDRTDAALLAHLSGTAANRDAAAALKAAKRTPLLEHLRSKKAAKATKKISHKGEYASAARGTAKKGRSKAEAKVLKTARGYLKSSIAGYGAQSSNDVKEAASVDSKAKGKGKEGGLPSKDKSLKPGKKGKKEKATAQASTGENQAPTPLGLKGIKVEKSRSAEMEGKVEPKSAKGMGSQPPKGPKQQQQPSQGSGENKAARPSKKSKSVANSGDTVSAAPTAILQRSAGSAPETFQNPNHPSAPSSQTPVTMTTTASTLAAAGGGGRSRTSGRVRGRKQGGGGGGNSLARPKAGAPV